MWLMRATRPDLSWAVVGLAKQVHRWTRQSDRDMHRVYQYLSGTTNRGTRAVVKHCDRDCLQLTAYTDSDFAGSKDSRKSTSGWAVFLTGPAGTQSLVDWGSKLQGFVSRSSAEAEMVAISRCTATRLVGYQQILMEVGLSPVRVELWTDSKTAMLCVAAGTSKTLRYIAKTQGVHMGWLRDIFEDPLYALKYVAAAVNPADTLTKPLARVKFSGCNEQLCVVTLPGLR